jgi:hypothetical protein
MKILSVSNPLKDSTSFILKDPNNVSILVRLNERLTVISTILNGMGINDYFLFFSKNKDHILYCFHNSYAKNLSHTKQGRSNGFPLNVGKLIVIDVNFRGSIESSRSNGYN